MYAQFSTDPAARAQYVIGVPPSSCLIVVNDYILYVVLVILLLCCCAVQAHFSYSLLVGFE